MNKSVIIVVIVIVLAIGAFFAYQFSSGPQAGNAGAEQANTADEASGGITKGSIAALIAAGKNVTCSFEREEASGSQQGTVYIAGNKMRGDFMIKNTAAEAYTMHMIRDDEWQYAWGGSLGAQQGVKIAVPEVASPSQAGGLNFESEANFDCRTWNADESLLTPPADVAFQTMGTMMPNKNSGQDTTAPYGATDKPDGATSIDCSACDQAPTEMRQQCLQSLGC